MKMMEEFNHLQKMENLLDHKEFGLKMKKYLD